MSTIFALKGSTISWHPNHSLPQITAGIYVSGPGKCGELISSDHIPGRWAQNRYTESLTHEKKTSHHRVFDSHSARKSYAYDINAWAGRSLVSLLYHYLVFRSRPPILSFSSRYSSRWFIVQRSYSPFCGCCLANYSLFSYLFLSVQIHCISRWEWVTSYIWNIILYLTTLCLTSRWSGPCVRREHGVG